MYKKNQWIIIEELGLFPFVVLDSFACIGNVFLQMLNDKIDPIALIWQSIHAEQIQ